MGSPLVNTGVLGRVGFQWQFRWDMCWWRPKEVGGGGPPPGEEKLESNQYIVRVVGKVRVRDVATVDCTCVTFHFSVYFKKSVKMFATCT